MVTISFEIPIAREMVSTLLNEAKKIDLLHLNPYDKAYQEFLKKGVDMAREGQLNSKLDNS